MRLQWLSVQVILLFMVLGLDAGSNPALARIQDTGRDPVEEAIQDQVGGRVYVANPDGQINDFLEDVQDFVQTDLLGPVNRVIRSTLGVLRIPDLSQLWSQIMGGSATREAGAVLSETLENKTDGRSSYAIREDLSKYGVRTAAIEAADQATLSQEAQTQMAQVQQATRQNTQENIQLAAESQSLDVTQQIMQNLSQQTALNSQVNERVLQEAQQARVDRAIGNTLSAQTARELSAITTADRRRTISAGNTASQQGGLLMMPGGVTLSSEP